MEGLSIVLTPSDVQLPAAALEVQISVASDAQPQVPYYEMGQLALWALNEIVVDQPAELSLAFVGANRMRDLNRDYRGVDKATDVLSFSSGWNEQELVPRDDQPLVLGDIVICPEVANRISYGSDMEFNEKLEVLVFHGILHLLGHDHEEAEQAAVMETAEDRLAQAWADWRFTQPQLSAQGLGAASAAGAARRAGAASASAGAAIGAGAGVAGSALGEQQAARASSRATSAGATYGTADYGEYADQDYPATEASLNYPTDRDINNLEQEIERKPYNLLLAFRWAFEGIIATIRSQRNMQIHLGVAALVIIVAFFMGLTAAEWSVLIIAIALVFAAEMLNTAIEVIVDLASPGIHPKAKLAKDIAAGVVLVTAICSVAVGLTIFINAILRLLAT
ncbi:MAG: rRNA maturation RNase YbeY [Coriobacteriales bacterium]|nr:rRNA maturation RNase YbeY [Coriobacteriales bacterium]